MGVEVPDDGLDFTVPTIEYAGKGKASQNALSDLHGVVAEYLTLAIATGRAPPATVNAAITFLKNNSITADASKNAGLSALQATLSKRKAGQAPSPALMKEADAQFAALMGGDLGMPQ